jgi:hypothetical protein
LEPPGRLKPANAAVALIVGKADKVVASFAEATSLIQGRGN